MNLPTHNRTVATTQPATRRSRIALSAVLLIALLAAALVPARGALARQDSVATLDVERGSAEVTQDDETQTIASGDRVLVGVGAQVALSDDGEATLTFFEGQETRLTPGAVVEVTALAAEGDNTEVEITVLLGQTISSVARALDAGSRFEVNTPAATATVRGTKFVVIVREGDLTQVTTVEGTVTLSAQGASLDIGRGLGTKLSPGEAPETLLVWGMAQARFVSPVPVDERVPVRFINRETGHVFYYRAGEVACVALGTYDIVIETPGPARISGVTFAPEQTTAGAVAPLPVALSAMRMQVVDDAGELMALDEPMTVHLRQDDLEGSATVMPGEAVLVGPGPWEVEIARASAPDEVFRMEKTVGGGEDEVIDVPAAMLGME